MEVLRHKYRQLDIEVDGGVGPSNIDAVGKVCSSTDIQDYYDFNYDVYVLYFSLSCCGWVF